MYLMKKFFFSISVLLLSVVNGAAQYTEQDTLRGSIGPGRDWWDVKYYALSVQPDYSTKTIKGKNIIRFNWLKAAPSQNYMQIDLQYPMNIDSVVYRQTNLSFERKGNAWFVNWPLMDHLQEEEITIYFHGTPREATNPPWDGGWVWTKDEKDRPWMTVACQGLGASVWYPCKDFQGDEPDEGASLAITVPGDLVAVANGRLKNKTAHDNNTATWQWEIANPINNYNIIPYIGYYANWTDDYAGEKGRLDCSFWVMDYNLDKAKKQFGANVDPMLKCFESWFGPYPFYKDGYKLVEAPHLGMEHQSAIAYGNKYRNGYLGADLSGTGWGNNWDYIIVHESGHEWFGNNITTIDIADMWVHEGFTDYAEALFVECQYGKKAANEYVQGLRNNIRNDKPVIGPYGVNKEGSGDMYYKGANMIHTIRQLIDNDNTFRNILRGLNKDLFHQTVTSARVEKYISERSGKDLSGIFNQYLRTASIPVMEWKQDDKTISYRWADCIPGFNMPVKLNNGVWLSPGTNWQSIDAKKAGGTIQPDPNFYIKTKQL